MYAAKSGLVIGFHGCDLSIRNRLVNGEIPLLPSENPYDWLGHGIYFWESSEQRAFDFVFETKLRQGRKSNIKTPAVVGAILDLGHCLDLLDMKYLKMLETSYKMLQESCNTLNFPIPVNYRIGNSKDLLLRYLDCAVINALHVIRNNSKLKPFDSVRGVFMEGKPLYNNAGFHSKDHIQICIRNPNCIKGYFIPRTANKKWLVP